MASDVIEINTARASAEREEKLENASAELCLCDTFLAAADNFLDEIRRWTSPDGVHPQEHLFDEVLHAQTMLSEVRDRARKAGDTISAVISGAAS